MEKLLAACLLAWVACLDGLAWADEPGGGLRLLAGRAWADGLGVPASVGWLRLLASHARAHRPGVLAGSSQPECQEIHGNIGKLNDIPVS